MKKDRKRGVYKEVIEPPDPLLNSFIDRLASMCLMRKEFGIKPSPEPSLESEESFESFPTIQNENFLAESISEQSEKIPEVHICTEH